MLPHFSYVRAATLEDAVEKLKAPGARLHAGGTDLLGCLRDGVFGTTRVVSLANLKELQGIEPTTDGGTRIGALTTLSEIAADGRIREKHPALAMAASEVASPQLRNQGTLGGNLCQRPRCWYFRGEFPCAKKGGKTCYAFEGENRYHAILGGGPCFIVHPSDTAVALIALEAVVRIAGPGGTRSVPLESFYVLPDEDITRETVLDSGEIVTEVLLPPPDSGARSSYRKVRERGAWDFALASIALSAEVVSGRMSRVRVVLGGVAPVPWRSVEAEEVLEGANTGLSVASRAGEAAVEGAEPMAWNGYKVELVKGIVEESVLAL